MQPFVLMVAKAGLQSESLVKLVISGHHTPRFLNEVSLLTLHAIAASVNAAVEEVTTKTLKSLHELFHVSSFPSSATKWPFPVDLHVGITFKDPKQIVKDLLVHLLLSPSSSFKHLSTIIVVEVTPIAVELARTADPNLLGSLSPPQAPQLIIGASLVEVEATSQIDSNSSNTTLQNFLRKSALVSRRAPKPLAPCCRSGWT